MKIDRVLRELCFGQKKFSFFLARRKLVLNRRFQIQSGSCAAFAATSRPDTISTWWPAKAAKASSGDRSKPESGLPARTATAARSAARTAARAAVVAGTSASPSEWRRNASCPRARSKKNGKWSKRTKCAAPSKNNPKRKSTKSNSSSRSSKRTSKRSSICCRTNSELWGDNKACKSFPG